MFLPVVLMSYLCLHELIIVPSLLLVENSFDAQLTQTVARGRR